MESVQGSTTLARPMTTTSTTPTDSLSPLKPFSPVKYHAPHALRIERFQGYKRTAAGDIKSAEHVMASTNPSFASPPSPDISTSSTVSSRFQRACSHARSRSHRHTRGISLDSNERRIAELSAQIRARLSYAASKVERNWPASSRNAGAVGNENNRKQSPSPLSANENELSKQLPGSPEGTTISAPDAPTVGLATIASNWLNSTNQSYGSTLSNPPICATRLRSHSSVPPQSNYVPVLQPTPKLAPPADIVANSGLSRRRPNPNIKGPTDSNINQQHQRPISQNQQSCRGDCPSKKPAGIVVPGTPPLRLSQHANFPGSTTTPAAPMPTPAGQSSRPVIKQRTPSQNALMEQDAIETLLFMSSPENSGYHANSSSSSQSRQQPQLGVNVSIAAQFASSNKGSGIGSQSSYGDPQSQNSSQNTYNSSQLSHYLNIKEGPFITGTSEPMHGARCFNTPIGLEAHAGDEIDRMLDRMNDGDDSDMEDIRQTELEYGMTPLSTTTTVNRS